MSGDLVPLGGGALIHTIRGIAVILDSDLAAALGMTTGVFNQSVKRHEDLVDERHRFQLTGEERDNLKSQSVISSSEWGGRRTLPWAYTERGVARVTTFINTPEAIRAADLIIDTFLAVHGQIAAGRREIAITNPDRYVADPELAAQSKALGKRLMTAINGLLDTVIDIRTGDSVADTAKDMTARALENVRERLREKGLENLKLEAEIQLILQEAAKVAQEVEGKKLENLEKRIDLVRKLIAMHRDMAPGEVMQLLGGFDAVARRLPPPCTDPA
jgi:hypothetical protein